MARRKKSDRLMTPEKLARLHQTLKAKEARDGND